MSESRGQNAASSLLFKLIESFGMQGVAFVVSIVLARLLSAEDYGVLGMLTVFIAVSQVFVQSMALFRKNAISLLRCVTGSMRTKHGRRRWHGSATG